MTTKNLPPHISMLLALHHRLSPSHPQFPYIEKKVGNELSGYYGETKLNYPLSKLPIVNQSLPNVRLRLHSNYFQLDYLVITQKFLLILESKYYSDDLTFDETVHQVVQQKGQAFRVFEDPVLQVEEQAYQLSEWLERHGFPEIPIESFVVMTNSQSRLRIDPSNVHHAEKVVFLQRLPSLFRELLSKHERDFLSLKEVSKLSHKIKNNQQTYLPNLLENYQISEAELLKGVFCISCGKLGVKMVKLRWQCPSCGNRNQTAHLNSLKDYFLLINKEIGNQEFRQFTGLKSRYTAKEILKRAST